MDHPDSLVGVSDADVYRMYAGELVRFAAVLVGGSDAEDVVSTVFARAMRSAGWAGVVDRRAYLFRAVTNEAKNVHRSRLRRQAGEARIPVDPTVEVGVPRPEVRAAVEGLSVRQRAVVFLAYWHDLSEEEIADRLGIGVGSVRRHLARARSRLREVLR